MRKSKYSKVQVTKLNLIHTVYYKVILFSFLEHDGMCAAID